MRRIVEALPVTRIELRRPTLEDVFIEIVQGAEGIDESRLRAELREGAPAGEGAEA